MFAVECYLTEDIVI